MKIGVYTIQSSIARPEQLQNEGFFAAIANAFGGDFERLELDAFLKEDFGLVYIATGGSESGFLEVYDRLKDRPIYILTSGESNSLAASMEILSYLRDHGSQGEILHGDAAEVGARIAALYKANRAKNALQGIRLGVVGKPSDWLIASSFDRKALQTKLGAEIVEIPMDELLAEIEKGGFAPNPWTDKLLAVGYDKEEVEKALIVYGAFRRLVDKYELGGVSVRCFDLLSSVKTTGCLGLAILNAEGIYGGCEGDVPSLVSMCILGAISGKPVFMCNPSRIDSKAHEIIFAHCTLPVNMPFDMQLTTHFESGIGVAIAGSILTGDCTVFKTSGDLQRHIALNGRLLENLRETNLCRTQIRVEVSDTNYFTKTPIANHHIVCTGDETDAIEAFFELLA